MSAASGSVMALDVGNARIGVALASREAKLASPLTTISNDEHTSSSLIALLEQHNVDTLVVGLPRNMAGDDTKQTSAVRNFVTQLKQQTNIPIDFQDEALTSVKAEEELATKKKPYTKADIDMLAATYILEDYLSR